MNRIALSIALAAGALTALLQPFRSGARGDADEATARALGITVDEVRRLHDERALANPVLLTMPRQKLEWALAKVRNPRPCDPDAAARWRLLAWRDGDGKIPEGAFLRAREQARAMPGPASIGGLSQAGWLSLGPTNIAGRVRAVAFDPLVPSTLYAGSVAGGVWKSTNAGATWTPVGDAMTNLAITSIVVDPTNSQKIYAATGEGFFQNADGFLNGDPVQGAGIFVSTDGGNTWAQMPMGTLGIAAFHWVNRIAISPDGQTLLAATRGGIRRWTAATNWTTAVYAVSNINAMDVDFHPTDNNRCVAHAKYVSGTTTIQTVLYSTNGGANWAQAAGPALASSFNNGEGGRIELAWHRGWPTLPGCVYAFKDLNFGTLYRSTNGGQTFTQVTPVAAPLSVTGTQGWYDLALWVDPTDTNTNVNDDSLLIGGIDLWRASGNGGVAFTQISDWTTSGSVHSDQHAIVERPGMPGTVYVGNDGGVFSTVNWMTQGIGGWASHANGFSTVQFYGGARRANGTIYGGTQDNGSMRIDPAPATTWTLTGFSGGGDGGFCAADPNNASLLYGEYVRGRVHRSSDDGFTADFIYGGDAYGNNVKPSPYRILDAANGNSNFIAPFVIDPNNSNRLLVGCWDLWRTNDAQTLNTPSTGPTWTNITTMIPAVANNYISAVAVNPANSAEISIGFNQGQIWHTTSGTAASPFWTLLGSPAGTRMVTRLRFHPMTGQLHATFGGFFSNNLWRRVGTSWSLIGTTGFSAPLRDVAFHPTDPNCLLVASEIGLLITADGGATWSASVSPLAVAIDEIRWSVNHFYLFTHGRGAFRQSPYLASATSVGQACLVGGIGPGPSFTITPPVLGGNAVLNVTGATLQPATAHLYMTAIPLQPTLISPGCYAQIEVTPTLTELLNIAVTNGTATITLGVPNDPALAGATAALQFAVISGPTTWLTNGNQVMLGN